MKTEDRIINEVKNTLRMENMSIDKAHERRIRNCISGKDSFDSLKKSLILEFSNTN